MLSRLSSAPPQHDDQVEDSGAGKYEKHYTERGLPGGQDHCATHAAEDEAEGGKDCPQIQSAARPRRLCHDEVVPGQHRLTREQSHTR